MACPYPVCLQQGERQSHMLAGFLGASQRPSTMGWGRGGRQPEKLPRIQFI